MRQRRATALSTAVVSTKVTPDERQILLDRANALGVALSEYIRQTALAEAGAATTEPAEYDHRAESLALVGGTT